MEAYIEYVILDNFAVDLLILLITLNILSIRIIKYKVFLGALIGTIGAVIMPVIPFVIAIIIRIILAPLMCLVVARYTKVKEYILTLLVMIVVTFAIGGAIIAIFNMSVADNYLILHYPDGGIIGLSAFAVILVYYVFIQLRNSFRFKIDKRELYNVELIIGENRIECKGFYDSGNSLYDNSNKPVLILDKDIGERIKAKNSQGEIIHINTVNGAKETRCYIIEKVMIYISGQVNTIYNVSCVISETSFKHYDLLLHKEMIKEG